MSISDSHLQKDRLGTARLTAWWSCLTCSRVWYPPAVELRKCLSSDPRRNG